ncbi:hypothetical protein CBR_g26203 [Chara braunii]|uniref:CCHC-type domain-containing protein n=1 Tax=Chara braunii TaxID=69332 RepID=A0A388L780_CHABU|nr:hypothetical protein CBR_g26203 [Chara braunii]|eukprot:GBG78170.1 hypothetical protein CBR_g26203 [Chara braunii]
MNNGGFSGNRNGGNGNYGNGNYGGGNTGGNGNYGGGNTGGSGQGPTCYNCGKTGHIARDCWSRRPSQSNDPELDGMKEFYRDLIKQKQDQEEKKRQEEERRQREEEDKRMGDELSRKAQELKAEMDRELRESLRKQQEELRKQVDVLKRGRDPPDDVPRRVRAKYGTDTGTDFSASEEESNLNKKVAALIRLLESRSPPTRAAPEATPRRSPRITPRQTSVTRRQTRFEQGESSAAVGRRTMREEGSNDKGKRTLEDDHQPGDAPSRSPATPPPSATKTPASC